MVQETLSQLFTGIVVEAKKLSLEIGLESLATKYEEYLEKLRETSAETVNLNLCIVDDSGKSYVIPRLEIPSVLRKGGDEAQVLVSFWRKL